MTAPIPRLATDARTERRALFELWLLNVAVGVVQAQAYRGHAPDGIGFGAHAFLEVALFSTLAWTSAIVGLVPWLASRIGLRGRLLAALAALVFTAWQVVLYIDGRTYDLFRYHVNGWVWTVLTTDGFSDSIDLGTGFWVAAGAVIAGAALAMYGFQRWRCRRAGAGPGFPKRLGIAVLVVVFVPLLADKAMYALADLRHQREVTTVAQLVPLYTRVTMRRVARKWFGEAVPKSPESGLTDKLLLRYPIERPRVRPDGPRPNLLVIAVESLRADMLSPEVMPNTWKFAEGGRRFLDHASGGSASRYGTFTLIYGLHGSYFAPAYAERASPVIVDTLKDLGYEIKVFGTSPMTFPELRSTAWVHVPEVVEDDLQPQPGESRDAELLRRYTRWVDTRPKDRPFYAFAFLDAPHFNYRVVGKRAPFKPYAYGVQRAVLSAQTAASLGPLLFNRYRNAVYDADYTIGVMLDDLARAGELDNTVVVITGDHGEEFFEHGFWGHTGNFTHTQVQVPMVMRGPGVPPGIETAPTSHVDVAPTLLELLGADPSRRREWTVGENMLAPDPHRKRVVSGWEVVAAWTPNAVIVLPLNAYRGFPDVYDYDWKPVKDPDAEIARSADALRDLAESTRRFLQ
ncbi:MAG: sulfatase-like hydrolase/transferase [Steroidobacteraceae bacterium]